MDSLPDGGFEMRSSFGFGWTQREVRHAGRAPWIKCRDVRRFVPFGVRPRAWSSSRAACALAPQLKSRRGSSLGAGLVRKAR